MLLHLGNVTIMCMCVCACVCVCVCVHVCVCVCACMCVCACVECCQQMGEGHSGSSVRELSVLDVFKYYPVGQSHSSLASSRSSFCCIFKWSHAACFLLCILCCRRKHHNYHTWLLPSPLARAPYIVLFNLKPLIKDGNLQMHEKEPQEPQNTLQKM